MALKLRRRTRTFTNGILPLTTGAGSFKRLLRRPLTDAPSVSPALQLTTGLVGSQSRRDRATPKATGPEGSDPCIPSPDSNAPSLRLPNCPHTSGPRAPADRDRGNG